MCLSSSYEGGSIDLPSFFALRRPPAPPTLPLRSWAGQSSSAASRARGDARGYQGPAARVDRAELAKLAGIGERCCRWRPLGCIRPVGRRWRQAPRGSRLHRPRTGRLSCARAQDGCTGHPVHRLCAQGLSCASAQDSCTGYPVRVHAVPARRPISRPHVPGQAPGVRQCPLCPLETALHRLAILCARTRYRLCASCARARQVRQVPQVQPLLPRRGWSGQAPACCACQAGQQAAPPCPQPCPQACSQAPMCFAP